MLLLFWLVKEHCDVVFVYDNFVLLVMYIPLYCMIHR